MLLVSGVIEPIGAFLWLLTENNAKHSNGDKVVRATYGPACINACAEKCIYEERQTKKDLLLVGVMERKKRVMKII